MVISKEPFEISLFEMVRVARGTYKGLEGVVVGFDGGNAHITRAFSEQSYAVFTVPCNVIEKA